jgi:hypothetical protein
MKYLIWIDVVMLIEISWFETRGQIISLNNRQLVSLLEAGRGQPMILTLQSLPQMRLAASGKDPARIWQ